MASDDLQPRRRLMVHGLTPARKSSGASSQQPAPTSQPSLTAPTAPFLIGHGYDIHKIHPVDRASDAKSAKPLTLAGIVISEDVSPEAYSDGDVVLHAITDALLGATGQGDIGEIFPPNDPRWKDIASRVFVTQVYDGVKRLGYRVSNLDVTLMLERPKVAPHKPAMLAYLRDLFGGGSQVNLKAGTNEECDAVGRGEAVAAHAVVLLARV